MKMPFAATVLAVSVVAALADVEVVDTTCSEAEACAKGPSGSEEGSLLQVTHRSTEEGLNPILQRLQAQGVMIPVRPSLVSTAATGPGCPDSSTWGILAGFATTTFNTMIKEWRPAEMSLTFDNSSTISGCSFQASGSGWAQLAFLTSTLKDLTCVNATCAAKSSQGCTEYNPIVIRAEVAADTIVIAGQVNDLSASWSGECPNLTSPGNYSAKEAYFSFNMKSPTYSATWSVDFVVDPFAIESPAVVDAIFSHGEFTEFACNVPDGHGLYESSEVCLKLLEMNAEMVATETMKQQINAEMLATLAQALGSVDLAAPAR